MEIYEKIVKLAEKPLAEWSERERVFVKKRAAAAGLELNPTCPNCLADAAVQLAVALKPKTETESSCDYQLRDGLDVRLMSYRYGEMHICAATLTNENAKKWIAAGCPLSFFTKTPDAD